MKAMHCLLKIAYEPAAADALRTLVMEAGEKFSDAITGKGSGGCRIESGWVALESCTAYLVLDAKDGVPIYDLCNELTRCAAGISVRVIPVLPVKRLSKKFD
jgi:hypothetical protein